MSEIIKDEEQYFCSICGKNPDDTPKVLKRYKPKVYNHILYCGNCETFFMIDCDDYPKKIHGDLVKWVISV